jgi:hypothetical protein
MTAAKPSAAVPLVSIYDSQRCLGFILARGKTGFEVFTANEQSLGLFQSQKGAVAALMAQ